MIPNLSHRLVLPLTPPRRSPATAAPDPRRRAVLGLCAGALLPHAAIATPGEIPIGGRLRDAPLEGLNGPSRRLARYFGRPLLVNVWASWCGPCIEEMSSIERLAWMDGRPPFAMIGISTDDFRDAALAFLRRSNATISHFIDHDQLLENMLGAAKIPLTVLVGSDGSVREKITGAREWDGPDALRLIARAFRNEKSLSTG
jgi:thiol-disulfide isomerase/thioredoxin